MLAGDDRVGGVDDGLRLLVADHAEGAVGGRGGGLDVRERLDVAGLEASAR